MRLRGSVLLAFVLIALPMLAGCGDGVNRGGELSGKVFLDAEPVTAGNVLIVAENDQVSAIGAIKADATYLIKDPPLGKSRLAVQTQLFRGRAALPVEKGKNGQPSVPGSQGMVLPEPFELGPYKETPSKYEAVETSGLSVEVKKGKQEFNLQLSRE